MTLPDAKECVAHWNTLGREFVEAGTRRGAWAGIERLVTEELYPDQSHFLFELLQNAEDAGASELHFSLSPESLSVWHDGSRLFNAKDVEAITNIGEGTKREDVNSIGKFGVGFKSVFAYTLAPRISSGVFHFKIRDLVCPEWVEPQERLNPRFTYFHLPFNRPSKPPRICFKEIAAALDRLPHSTLLFLRSVSEITWKVAGKSNGFIKKDTPERRRTESSTISVRQRDSSGKTKTTHWLKFDAPIRANPQLNCSVAFLLTPPPKSEGDLESDAQKRGKGPATPFVIAPLSEPGHLHIYFPAGKEPTGLFFHIHAPFAATVDRASIPFDHDGNRELVSDLALHCAKCLHEVKKQGLLLPQFLGVLPNEKDELDEFYEPIRRAIVAEFRDQPLLPTHHGQFTKAKDAVFGPRELRQFFSDEDLQYLKGEPNSVWSPGFRNSSRPDFFLDTLEITAIDWQEFANYLGGKLRHDLVSPQQVAASQRWLRKRMSAAKSSTEWLRSFYLLLLKADKNIRPHQWAQPDENLRKASVVWTNEDTFLPGDNLFFSTGSIAVPGVQVQTIHLELFDLDKKQSEKAKELRAALEMLGVQEYDEEAAIVALVQQIGSQKQISRKDHLAQMKCVLEWHRAGKIHDFKPLSSTHLFLEAEAKYYRKPEVFYLDAPFSRTGIAPFFAGVANRYALWPGYLEHFGSVLFSSFAEKVGVASDIPIRETTIPSGHPDRYGSLRTRGRRHTSYGIDEDWMIDGLEELLARREPEVNKALWNALCKSDPEVLWARYRPNKESEIQTAPSSLVHALRKAEWVLGADGSVRRPDSLTTRTIAAGWLTDDSNGWMEAVGFGSAAKAVEAEVIARREAAEKIGLAPELAEELRSLSDEQQKELLERIKASKRRGSDFPQDEGSDSGLRAQRAAEQAAQARDVERGTRSKRVRLSSNRPEVREYLSQKYTRDGRLYCQMSQEPMPFVLPSNEPYFVAVEILPLGKEIEANHLCLSPTCAAEFRHALLTDDNDLRARILEVVPDANQALEVEVEVPLHEHRRIRFSKRHLTDLQEAIRVCGGGG